MVEIASGKGPNFSDAVAIELLGLGGTDGIWDDQTVALMNVLQNSFGLAKTPLPAAEIVSALAAQTPGNPPPDLATTLADIQAQQAEGTAITPVTPQPPVLTPVGGQSQPQPAGKKLPTWAWVAIGVTAAGALAGGVYAIYYFTKKKPGGRRESPLPSEDEAGKYYGDSKDAQAFTWKNQKGKPK